MADSGATLPAKGNRPPQPVVTPRWTGQQIVLYVVAVLVIAVAAASLGWRLHDHATGKVTIAKSFTGTVSYLSADGVAGCVTPDGGSQVCSVISIEGDVPAPRVGDKVIAAHEWVNTGGGNGYDLLLIAPLHSPQ